MRTNGPNYTGSKRGVGAVSLKECIMCLEIYSATEYNVHIHKFQP